jgi:23S rRNA pseudouridine1911/1915/1917 synthase
MTRISTHDLPDDVLVVRPEGLPSDSVVTVLRVPPELAGMRLDRFVQSQMKRTSRTRAQFIVTKSAFSPSARPLRSNDRVRAEQLILLWRAPWDEQAPDVAISVLYEDAELVAIDKPPGIPVHPTARYHKSTVIKLLEAARDGERLFLAHRIDRETSGVLLLSRTKEADRHIKRQFEERDTVTKSYLAIARGSPPASFRVELPLWLDSTSRYKVKMAVALPGHGLTAATGFEVVERRVNPSTHQAYALVRCALETGRQHQIRVHLAASGWPIVGDKLYGPDEDLFARGADHVLTPEDLAVLELERHALHAAELSLTHPTTGERVHVVAPLPLDMHEFWKGLNPMDEPAEPDER